MNIQSSLIEKLRESEKEAEAKQASYESEISTLAIKWPFSCNFWFNFAKKSSVGQRGKEKPTAIKMNLISAVRFYIDKVCSDPTMAGMKVLLLDATTTKVVSMVYSQTQILDQEVYLVEQLGKQHEPMLHLKAALFVQPTDANIDMIISELKDPKFQEYHLFFTNIISQEMMARIARADEAELVRQVQEYYANYMVINEDFFHLGVDNTISLSSPQRSSESARIFDRNVSGLLSVLLSLKRLPSQIRYQSSSELARRVAGEVINHIERDDIFDFRRQEGPLLLILDRRDDPITPLLTQWTYQAMVHELLGLNYNRVVLRGAPNVKADLEEVVLSCTQDEFFCRNRFSNFGDLGSCVKDLLDDYQRSCKMNENINSIQDMQAFVERYPAFRSQSINVSKHVAVISELSRLTDICQLLDISELEQEISCSSDHSRHKRELFEKIASPRVQMADKLRLGLLFVLRYESYNEVKEIQARLMEQGMSRLQTALLDAVLEYAGENRRGLAQALFSRGSMISKIGQSLASSLTGVSGAQNVYTQHTPVLSMTLEAIKQGTLKDSAYPVLFSSSASASSVSLSSKSSAVAGGVGSGAAWRPSEVIVFIVGGATFEEATKVAEFNANYPSMKILLGGSCVHNSTSFLKDVVSNFGR